MITKEQILDLPAKEEWNYLPRTKYLIDRADVLLLIENAVETPYFSDFGYITKNQQTELSKRLREIAKDENAMISAHLQDILRQAADEIDRYYTGMCDWKQSAEAKDKAK